MKDTFRKGLSLGLGLATAGYEQAEKIMSDLVKKGEMTRDEAKTVLNEYITKGENTQSNMKSKLNVATQDDIKRLELRIDALAEQLNREMTE